MDAQSKSILDSLGDALLLSVMWDGKWFVLVWELPYLHPTLGRRIRVRCAECVNVRIVMDSANLSGPPLLFESAVESGAVRRWRLSFDFGGAPAGEIELDADDIVVEQFNEPVVLQGPE